MNVGDRLNTAGNIGSAEAARQVTGPPPAETTHVSIPATDTTYVSHAAQLAQQAMALPDVRMDKVAAMREAIGNGTYRVEASAVADAIARSMSDGGARLP